MSNAADDFETYDFDLLEGAKEWISGHLSPEDVFDEDALSEWAQGNGYKKEEMK